MKQLLVKLLKFLAILVLIIAALLSIPIKSNTLNHFILSSFEKKIAKELNFKTSKIWLPGNIFLEDMSVSDKNGILCTAKDLNINYNPAGILLNNKEVSFKARNLRVHQDINLLTSVSNMLTIPKMPKVEFKHIDGVLDFRKDAIYIKNIAAETDAMKIEGDGWAGKGGDLNCRFHFSFGSSLVGNVPDIVKATLLTDEGGGWMGITLNATGNYATLSIQIDSETFKMNIRETILKLK